MLCLLPVLGLMYAFRAYAHQRELAQHNARLALRNERLFLQAVKSQVTALDVKDNYTARHSAAVARWATDIAQSMALSKHEQNITHLASLVHDVGKIGVPDEVLNSPGQAAGRGVGSGGDPLPERVQDPQDHRPVRRVGQSDALSPRALRRLRLPVGLVGENIPFISRIICVADSYSAMVSDRPYRKALPAEIARRSSASARASSSIPVVVECFLEVLAEHDIPYRRARRPTSTWSSRATASCANCPPSGRRRARIGALAGEIVAERRGLDSAA